MNQSLSFDGKTYISVSRASKKFGYTADYVGQLCRAGKIDARMIGRTWYVEWESIKNHKKTKKHRIRRTAEEIRREREQQTVISTPAVINKLDLDDCPPDEYLAKIDAEINEVLSREKKEEEIAEPVVNLIPLTAVALNKKEDVVEIHHASVDRKQVEEALPITYSYDIQNDWLPKLSKKSAEVRETPKHVISLPHYNPMLALTLAIFIFLNLVFVGINILSPQTESNSIVRNIENALDLSSSNSSLAVNGPNDNTQNLSSIYGGIQGVWEYLVGPLKTKINRFAIRYMDSLGFAQKNKTEEIPTTKAPITNGLVVLPDDKNHDAKVASIKKTFSDEVEIKEDADSQSGVITPKFREADGEGYTYVLIPIDSP
jgi:hypothetical protein